MSNGSKIGQISQGGQIKIKTYGNQNRSWMLIYVFHATVIC